MTKNRIGIIGSGPSAIYALKHLIDSPEPLDVIIFESTNEVGKGMPYRSDINADYMLCNAFSREIPKVTRSLIDWLSALPPRELGEWELSVHELSARAFYPRLVIGEFLEEEFRALCKLAQTNKHMIGIKSSETVTDIIVAKDAAMLVRTNKNTEPYEFDHVIIATGHTWPEHPKVGDAELISPWPYTSITKLPAGNIGILGSSLSAIDIVAALGHSHGAFTDSNGTVSWQPNHASATLRITMVSRNGIMPEGDFYYPFPYEPLKVITPEAVDQAIEAGSDGLLGRVFDLLCKELDKADPQYLKTLGKEARTLDGFADAYFKQRQDRGGVAAVKTDFAKVRKSMRDRQTIAYRYVLLRAHENFDRALRALDDDDWKVFVQKLLPVFTDCYAAVPHLSLARVIAMYDAGVLELMLSGDDASFTNGSNGGVDVDLGEETLHFDVMIDARGQVPAPLYALPFPSLVSELRPNPEHIIAPFKLKLSTSENSAVYCLALPQVMERYPFCQGLTNCAENGKIVAAEILKSV